MKNQALFEPYEIVEIQSKKLHLRPISGKKGIIIGISESEEAEPLFAYSVHVPFCKETLFIMEEDLRPTGRKADPNKFETDSYLRVDDQGQLIEDE
jgi:hypothetical protein